MTAKGAKKINITAETQWTRSHAPKIFSLHREAYIQIGRCYRIYCFRPPAVLCGEEKRCLSAGATGPQKLLLEASVLTFLPITLLNMEAQHGHSPCLIER